MHPKRLPCAEHNQIPLLAEWSTNYVAAPLSWAKLIGRLDLRLEDSVACACLFDDQRLDLAISWALSVSNEN